MRKIGQNTYLDNRVLEFNKDKFRSQEYYTSPQVSLPYNKEKTYVDLYTDPQKIEDKPLQLVFPKIEPYHVQTKPITDTSKKFLTENYIDILTTPKAKADGEKQIKEIFEIDKNLESAKQKLLERYNILQLLSIDFYNKYKEANVLAQATANIDYNISYLTFVKTLPHILYNLVTRKIGQMFGKTPDKTDNIEKLLTGQQAYSLELFNIQSIDLYHQVEKINLLITEITNILEFHHKRQKLLVNFLKNVNSGVNKFLKQAENIEFLTWMEENYPDYKQQIYDEVVNNVSQHRVNMPGLYIDMLERNSGTIKNYKDIYDRSIHQSTQSLYEYGPGVLKQKLIKTLTNEVMEKVYDKINPLILITKQIGNLLGPGYTELQWFHFKDLQEYTKTYLNFNLKSIFNIEMNSYSYRLEEENKHVSNQDMPEAQKNIQHAKEKRFREVSTNYYKQLLQFITDSQITDITDAHTKFYIEDIEKKYHTGLQQVKELEKINTKDIDRLVINIIKRILTKPLEFMEYGVQFKTFSTISCIIKEENIDAIDIKNIFSIFYKHFPDIPKEFGLHLTKFIFKNKPEFLNYFSQFGHKKYIYNTVKLIEQILKKFNKFTPDNFTNFFIENIHTWSYNIDNISRNLKAMLGGNLQSYENITYVITSIIRSLSSATQDLKLLDSFVAFAHNNLAGIKADQLIKLTGNVNFYNYEKLKIIKKLFNSYSLIMDNQGLAGIIKKYKKFITEFKKRNIISQEFENNIKYIIEFFDSNQIIKPHSDSFRQVFTATSTFETDIELLKLSESIKDLLKGYKKKNENLFKLDYNLSDRLRFRVLKDKDPRMLRIGIETNCCQRIGGAGEIAARDSFINQLAGVLILEYKNNEGEWLLLAQSYFHYVPKDNGYILDNIEYNEDNVDDSKLSLEEIYAYYATKVKEMLKPKYFVAGKGYSKIDAKKFNRHVMKTDPRTFDPRALTPGDRDHYSDFDEKNSIDLLGYRDDLTLAFEKFEKKQANNTLKQIRKLALSSRRVAYELSA